LLVQQLHLADGETEAQKAKSEPRAEPRSLDSHICLCHLMEKEHLRGCSENVGMKRPCVCVHKTVSCPRHKKLHKTTQYW
jgi:hypothetical protein